MDSIRAHIEQQHPISHDGDYSSVAPPPEDLSALSGTVLTPLYQYGLLSVSGPDANRFLQGQTSCDFRAIEGRQAAWGAYCNPKGRMQSSFLAAALDAQHYLLRMRRDLVEPTQQALSRYIVFSKAEMRDDSETYLALGLYGDGAAQLLEEATGLRPEGPLGAHVEGEALAIQLDSAGRRFECWLGQARALELWPRLAAQAQLVGSAYWEWLNIREGLGEVCAATYEVFTPHALNYQLTGAVNFKKGCYTGQEVVARMHYRATLKNHMYRAQLTTDTPPAPGATLYRGQRSVGQVVNAVQVAPRRCELLAVLNDEAAASGEVRLSTEGPALELLDLPYSLAD